MIDRHTRPVAERVLSPLAAACPVSPNVLTAGGLGVGLAAALAAGVSLWPVAIVLWLINRFVDGLDGAVARLRQRQSDLGAYFDILADVTVYAAIPLGIAIGRDDRALWIATAALMAAFYINATSWLYLSAVLEKRQQGASQTGEPTSVTMPVGLVEGTETIVFFLVMLAVPSLAAWTMALMTAGVVLTIVGRLVAAPGTLSPLRRSRVSP